MDQLDGIWNTVRGYGLDLLLRGGLAAYNAAPKEHKQYWVVRTGGDVLVTSQRYRSAPEAATAVGMPLSAALTAEPSHPLRGIERLLDPYEAIPAGTRSGPAREVRDALANQVESLYAAIRVAERLGDHMDAFRADPLSIAESPSRSRSITQRFMPANDDAAEELKHNAATYGLVTAWFWCANSRRDEKPSRAKFISVLRERTCRKLVEAVAVTLTPQGTAEVNTTRDTTLTIAVHAILSQATFRDRYSTMLRTLTRGPAPRSPREAFALTAFVLGEIAKNTKWDHYLAEMVASAICNLGVGAVFDAIRRRQAADE